MVSQVVDDACAGFALTFPVDHPCNLGRSFFIIGKEKRWIVFLSDATETADVHAPMEELKPGEGEVHAVTNLIPLPVLDYVVTPGSEGYADTVFRMAEIEAKFFNVPERAPDGTPGDSHPLFGPYTMLNEAKAYGTLTPETLAIPIIVAESTNSQAKEWETRPKMSLGAVVEKQLSRHDAGKKDGKALVAGALGKNKRRSKANVLRNYFVELDVDNGASFDAACKEAQGKGLFFIAYSGLPPEAVRANLSASLVGLAQPATGWQPVPVVCNRSMSVARSCCGAGASPR